MAPRTIGLILTFNGERLLARCLASLAFCDEVMVVDSLSTDATCDIARAAGAQVLERRWEGPGPQFRFALEHIRAMQP
ncbi:MAG: glycosyltransferase family 2 protein, partial [Desulfovibrio sp.]|nr:glycosyltransferase family 2 protein [Desulfovibrio sp.]